MATSSTFGTSNGNVKFNITETTLSQSIEGNYSIINIRVRFWRTNTGYSTYGNGTVYCRANGALHQLPVSSVQKITSAGIDLMNFNVQVPHNSDGSKAVSLTAWINIPGILTATEQGFSPALATIPRASTPTLSAASTAVGSKVTIYTNKKANFTHDIHIYFGDWAAVVAEGVVDSYQWTLPTSLANEMPNNTSGVGTIYILTFNGSQHIGTAGVQFTATVPTSYIPSISTVSVAESTSGLTTFSGFLEEKSKLRIKTTCAGTYGSTIKSISNEIDGKTYIGSDITTELITTSGNLTLTTVVTDSRNRTKTTTKTITVIPYFNPIINAFSMIRCDSNGTENESGSSAKFVVNFAIAAANNKNTKTYKIEYKRTDQTTWSTAYSGSTYSYNTTLVKASILNVDYRYQARLTITDFFTNASYSVEVGTGFSLINFRNTGKGIAFGKVSEMDGIEIKMPFNVLDTPVVQKAFGVTSEYGAKDASYCRFNTTAPSGNYFDKQISTTKVIARDGDFETQGSYGWKNTTHGGGFNMTDTSYIRVTGDKNILLPVNRIYYANSGQNLLFNYGPNSSARPRIDGFSYANTSYMEVSSPGGARGINWWGSDVKLKRQIKPTAKKGIDFVEQLEHVEFIMKEDGSKLDIGYIAQDLEKLDINLINEVYQGEELDSTIKHINHAALIPYLSKAIQELIEQNNKLTERIEKLEGK